jgi:hypothetical protein
MRALLLGLFVVVLVFPAQSGAEYVWVDANGRTIGPFLGGWYGTYIDEDGLQWNVDPETASLYVVNYWESYDRTYFTEPNCAGASYSTPFPPRWVYKLNHWPFPRFRPDWLASQEVRVASMRYGSCQPYAGTLRLVPESELIELDGPLPDLGACPPLHVELRRDPK